MYAPKLQKGDEIRIIAPSASLNSVRENVFHDALEYLQSMGYRVTFSEKSREIEYADSASIRSRVEDIHDAFSDKNVKAILTARGGFNVNQILEYIDYSLIRDNPKILCGFSDITALLNAVYAKTGLITYHGPHFCTFGFELGREYTHRHFEKCLVSDGEYSINPSVEAGEYTVIQEGECEGTIIGGNLCTLNLLQGTEFMPELRNAILFLEDDNIMGEYFTKEFDRNLQSLLQVRNIELSGIVFGRFSDDCNLSVDTISHIVKSKKQLQNIPIIFNVDFGHVFPILTFPIGGTARLTAHGSGTKITLLCH